MYQNDGVKTRCKRKHDVIVTATYFTSHWRKINKLYIIQRWKLEFPWFQYGLHSHYANQFIFFLSVFTRNHYLFCIMKVVRWICISEQGWKLAEIVCFLLIDFQCSFGSWISINSYLQWLPFLHQNHQIFVQQILQSSEDCNCSLSKWIALGFLFFTTEIDLMEAREGVVWVVKAEEKKRNTIFLGIENPNARIKFIHIVNA